MSHLVELYPDGNGMNEQGDVVPQADYHDADGDVVDVDQSYREGPEIVDLDEAKRKRWDEIFDEMIDKAGSARLARLYTDRVLGYDRPPELAPPKPRIGAGTLAIAAMKRASVEEAVGRATKGVADPNKRTKITVEVRAKARAHEEISKRGY